MKTVLPREIREELQKASGFVQQDNPEKAIEYMQLTLRAVRTAPLAVRRLAAPKIAAFLAGFAQLPRVRVLLDNGESSGIPYRLGQERTLAIVLDGFLAILRDQQRITEEAGLRATAAQRKAQLFERGTRALNEGSIRLALAFFERLLLEFPADTDYCLEAAEALLAAHRFREAQSFLERVIACHVRFAPAYRMLLTLLMDREDVLACEALFDRTEAVFGEQPKTLLQRALFRERTGRFPEALTVLSRLLALAPDMAEARALRDRLVSSAEIAAREPVHTP